MDTQKQREPATTYRNLSIRPIPEKLKQELVADEYYSRCARVKTGDCYGRITWEQAFIYAGKQINKRWAIIPLCEYHHLRNGLDKGENQRIALARATPDDLAKYPNFDWEKRRKYLHNWAVVRR